MKIGPKNLTSLCKALKSSTQLESISLNFNFNELNSEDMRTICDSVEGKTLKNFEMTFKGCGIPRNGFKKLCIFLQLAVEVSDRLSLDFTM